MLVDLEKEGGQMEKWLLHPLVVLLWNTPGTDTHRETDTDRETGRHTNTQTGNDTKIDSGMLAIGTCQP